MGRKHAGIMAAALVLALVMTLGTPVAMAGDAGEVPVPTAEEAGEASVPAAGEGSGPVSVPEVTKTTNTENAAKVKDDAGAVYTGFRTQNGKKYYYKKGVRYTKKGFKTIDGKRYYFQKNGVVYTKKGFKTIDGKRYYFRKNGVVYTKEGFKSINGKRYYFQKKGEVYKKKGFHKIDGKKYYFYTDGSIAAGPKKISGEKYLFSNKGVLLTNKRAYMLNGKYYNTDQKGHAVRISEKKAQCEKAAAAFIKKHGGSSNSKAKQFRNCYNYLLWYMKFVPGSWEADKKYYESDDGIYELALETFESSGLRGNCHRFAACVAAVASELGYTPYVITTPGDHSFVKIDGKYYDNMGGLFGASSHSSYSVFHQQKY